MPGTKLEQEAEVKSAPPAEMVGAAAPVSEGAATGATVAPPPPPPLSTPPPSPEMLVVVHFGFDLPVCWLAAAVHC
jgi:hypothetical protein